jgi:ribosomal protein L33
MSLVEEKRCQAIRSVFSKDRLLNVLPYEAEKDTKKLDGKALTEPPDGNHFIYRFDDRDRVILIETVDPFPYYFAIYTYHDDVLEKIFGDVFSGKYGITYVEWAYLESGAVVEKLRRWEKSSVMEVYSYDQAVLRIINCHQIWDNNDSGISYDYEFTYDVEGVLCSIRRVDSSGDSEMIYATSKAKKEVSKRINFKKFGQTLRDSMEQAISAFLSEHEWERFACLALNFFTGFGYVTLSMGTDADYKEDDHPTTWTYPDFASFPLFDFRLSDSQTFTLSLTTHDIARGLIKSDCLKALTANGTFQISVFSHGDKIYWT